MVLPIKISQNSREKLGLVVCIVCAILAACGLVVIGLAIYMQIHINNQLMLLESYNSGMLPHFLISVGTLMILLNGVSAKIGYDAGFSNTSERFRVALVPLLIILALFCIVIMAAGIVCLTHRSNIEAALHNGLTDAMKRYKNNIKVKVAIDKLQMTSRCCGSRSAQDWFNVGWINTDYVNKKSPQVQAKMKDGELYVDSVPFSCCSVLSRRPCVAHNIAEKSLNKDYDEKTLYQAGCTDKLMDELENKLLYPAGSAVLTLFGIQVLVTMLLRYMQTSVQNAFEEGDPEGTGTGFCIPTVCPAGCCPGDPDKYVRAGAIQASRGEEMPSLEETDESFMGQPTSGDTEESFLGQAQVGMDRMDRVIDLEGGGGPDEDQGKGKQKDKNGSNKKDKSSSKSKKDRSSSKSKKDRSSSKSKKDKSSSKSKKDRSSSKSPKKSKMKQSKPKSPKPKKPKSPKTGKLKKPGKKKMRSPKRGGGGRKRGRKR